MQDRAIEIIRCHPAGGCRTQRAIIASQRLLPLPGRPQLHAADVVQRDLREMDVAAWHIDAAGQRMQNGVCTRGLRGVGVLLEAGPGEVCQRAMMPEQMRGLPYDFGRDARYPGGILRRIGAAQFREAGKGRAAGNWSIAAGDRERAGKGKTGGARLVTPR
jgi:hypothetical protein